MINCDCVRFEDLTDKQIEFFRSKVLPLEIKKIEELKEVAQLGLFGVKLERVEEYMNRCRELAKRGDLRGLYELICRIDGKTFIQ